LSRTSGYSDFQEWKHILHVDRPSFEQGASGNRCPAHRQDFDAQVGGVLRSVVVMARNWPSTISQTRLPSARQSNPARWATASAPAARRSAIR
jgi:hypothetical protein